MGNTHSTNESLNNKHLTWNTNETTSTHIVKQRDIRPIRMIFLLSSWTVLDWKDCISPVAIHRGPQGDVGNEHFRQAPYQLERSVVDSVYSIHSPSSGPPKDGADLEGWGVGGVPHSPTNPPCTVALQAITLQFLGVAEDRSINNRPSSLPWNNIEFLNAVEGGELRSVIPNLLLVSKYSI